MQHDIEVRLECMRLAANLTPLSALASVPPTDPIKLASEIYAFVTASENKPAPLKAAA